MILRIKDKEFKEVEIEVERISNYLLFDKPAIVEPQIPKFFIQSQNRWVENPSHPDYVEGLQLYQVQLANYAFNLLLKKIKLCDNSILNNKSWKKIYKRIIQSSDEKEDEIFLFLKNFIFDNDEAKVEVINKICLTETKVYHYFERFVITRFGENIHKVDLTNTINTGIAYNPVIIGKDLLVNPIDEWTACTKSNMNWDKWLNNEYSLETMALTIAIQRLSKLTELHSEDEQAKQQNKKNKSN